MDIENVLFLCFELWKMASTEKIREYELKQKAVQYYQENGVPKKMEEILNQMFFDNPDDVFGHLVCY